LFGCQTGSSCRASGLPAKASKGNSSAVLGFLDRYWDKLAVRRLSDHTGGDLVHVRISRVHALNLAAVDRSSNADFKTVHYQSPGSVLMILKP